ncbi:hypothetical protein Tco_1535791, partial [Tanacetum coccineum]
KSSEEEDDDEVNMGNDNDDDADNQDDVEDDEQDDVNEQTDSDNDGDDFVHPKLSTHDEEDKKEEDSDPRVHTPSNYESTNDEESDKEIQGGNVEGEEMDEEETNEEDEANKLYRDVNVNLEGRDTEMTDAPHVPVTTFAEPPLFSTTTLPPPPTPLITHLQQTPIPTPATAPSSSLQDLPNFGSLFGSFFNSTKGSKSHQKSADESAQAEDPMQTSKDLKEPTHQEFEIGVTKDQLDEETSKLPDWFQKPAKPPTPDRDWNKTLPDTHGPVQPWLNSLAQMEDLRKSFNELMDTPLDFSAFVMNQLKVDTLTPELLIGPTFELMKGSCKSLVELEYFFEEVYKATTDQLD